MLHIAPETIQYLKQEQARVEAIERRRAAIAVHKPKRTLDPKRFNRLVDVLSLILRAGRPTPFEFEGACRHGLRVSLIRQGWSWADADANAAEVVCSGLAAVGAERPTWEEGQLGFGDAHRVERYGCARCGKRIDDSRKTNGTAAKYCSELCSQAARQAKARLVGSRLSLAEHLAKCALKSERMVRERSGPCEVCGTYMITRSATKRFCSPQCAHEGHRVRKRKACTVCGNLFAPRLRKDGLEETYCTLSCSAVGRRKPNITKNCKQCGAVFVLRSGSKQLLAQSFCSQKCSGEASRVDIPHSTCPTCKTIFRWSSRTKPQTFCSAPCSPRSPKYIGRQKFKCVEAV